MSLLSVLGESFAAELLAVFIGGYKLRNPRESFCEGGNLIAEINEQVALWNVDFAASYSHRGILLAARFRDCMVRHETAIAECPEQLVETLCAGMVTDVDMNSVLEPIGFLRQSAREGLT